MNKQPSEAGYQASVSSSDGDKDLKQKLNDLDTDIAERKCAERKSTKPRCRWDDNYFNRHCADDDEYCYRSPCHRRLCTTYPLNEEDYDISIKELEERLACMKRFPGIRTIDSQVGVHEDLLFYRENCPRNSQPKSQGIPYLEISVLIFIYVLRTYITDFLIMLGVMILIGLLLANHWTISRRIPRPCPTHCVPECSLSCRPHCTAYCGSYLRG